MAQIIIRIQMLAHIHNLQLTAFSFPSLPRGSASSSYLVSAYWQLPLSKD